MFRDAAITIVLLFAFAVPVVMAVACVVIARHLYPPGQRVVAALAGAVGSIGLPLLIIVGMRDWKALHERLPGEIGPFLAIVLFAVAAVVAPGALLWIRKRKGRPGP